MCENKDLNENIENLEETCDDTSSTESDDIIEPELDVDALSEADAKSILKEVLESNKALVSELNEKNSLLQKATSEATENKDKWYRSVAEFENFRKRNQETRRNAYIDGQKDVLLKILVIGDSIDRALTMDMDEKTREGVTLISRQFTDTLNSLGVTEINPVGKAFDPNTCEAIHSVPKCEGEEGGTIKTVFKKGYKLANKIIRYCQVVVINND